MIKPKSRAVCWRLIRNLDQVFWLNMDFGQNWTRLNKKLESAILTGKKKYQEGFQFEMRN